MHLEKNSLLIRDKQLYFVEMTYEESVLPLSAFDTLPTPCYFIKPLVLKGQFGPEARWLTINEMQVMGYRLATPAERILYGSR